ncbi:MAG TPA: DoxX family protein [Chryseosolibacter sp.]
MTTLNATLTASAPSKGKVWASRIMGGLVILFMLMDSVFKFIVNEEVIKGTTELGFSTHHLPILGTLGLISIVLYALPRTSVIGAILLTGYWGGAIATHVRMDNPLFSHVLFPVYLGILAWGAVFLKNEQLRKAILGNQ